VKWRDVRPFERGVGAARRHGGKGQGEGARAARACASQALQEPRC
jgi:hypothetical protein